MKTCYRCHISKEVSEFGNSNRFKDGLRKECLACSRADSLDYRNRNLEKQRQSKRNWAERNSEKVLAYARSYHQANRASILPKALERSRIYAINNPAKVKTSKAKYGRIWRQENKARINAKTAARFALKLNASVKWANLFLLSEAYDLARRRKIATGIDWHVDHIVPLRSNIVCGLHVEDNVRVIPAVLNLQKGNYFWPEMP